MTQSPSQRYQFGAFVLDAGERVLLREGQVVPLTPKVFDTLLVLVEQAGRVVEKEALIEAVWPNAFVEESNLTQNIFVLRKALGQDETGQPLIRTISRRGYLFAAHVEIINRVYPWPQRLTFRRGSIQTARFAPDDRTVVYAAAWEGRPVEIFQTSSDSPESRPLGLSGAGLLAVSPSGEVAAMLRRRLVRGFVKSGMLARVPLAGGEPREVLAGAQWADWVPDGKSLAVVRDVDGRNRLEYPVGTVLYETGGWVSHARFSPRGDRIAFLDHPIQNDDGGSVAVVNLDGERRTLSTGWVSAQGLAWSPDGEEVWFTAARTGNARAVRAVRLTGQERLVERGFGGLTIHDISRTGRVLLTQDDVRLCINCLAPGEEHERDLSWFDWSLARDLSPDGRWLLFTEAGEAGGVNYGVYMRRTDGSPAVRLGDGSAIAFSPDMTWALSIPPASPTFLTLLPTGAGDAKVVESAGVNYHMWASWLPDGKRIVFTGNLPGAGTRLYIQGMSNDGPPHAITPETEGVYLSTPHAVSPDGRWIAALAPDHRLKLFPVEGGHPRAVAGLEEFDVVTRWGSDGRSLLVFKRDEVPVNVSRIDLATGAKTPLVETKLLDRAGVHEILRVLLTPDGQSYAYTYTRDRSDLYLIDGMK